MLTMGDPNTTASTSKNAQSEGVPSGNAPDISAQSEGAVSEDAHSQVNSELEDLRTLILGGSPEEMLRPRIDSDTISKLLPEAISKAHEQGPALMIATLPTVESAIQSSVQTDVHVLAESLFPVIGPATRQSINSAIGNLVQSLNQTLDYSLSPRSLKWRLEARRTGKTFAEVVLIRTLVYRVEQIFLIHRETGLVIQHVVAESAEAKDPDLVSAMLTAIQDFIHDSFSVNPEDAIDSLKLGDFTLLVEEGPQAIIAGVVRGTPPNDLQELLRSQLETIHRSFGPTLRAFDGDQNAFEQLQPYLKDCFQSQFKDTKQAKKKKKRPTLSPLAKRFVWGLLSLLLITFGIWAFLNWQSNRQWQQYLKTVTAQPGLVVIEQHKRRGTYHLQGLRDPLADDPAELLSEFKLRPRKVKMSWDSYLSLDPAFVANRTNVLFNPPGTVSMRIDPNGLLHVSGVAPATWIANTKQLSQKVKGITGWQAEQLVAAEQASISKLKGRIEHRRFVFQLGSADVRSPYFQTRYLETLQHQAQDIAKLIQTAEQTGQPVTIIITAYGDRRAQSDSTLQLAQIRANTLKRYLENQGIKAKYIQVNPFANPPANPQRESPIFEREEEAAAYFQVQL